MEGHKKIANVSVELYDDGQGSKENKSNKLTKGCTRLMYACQQGNTGTIIKELRAKPSAVLRRDRNKKSALHYCAEQTDLVAAASVAVAAPELLESADEDGFTPLHLAVIQGNMAMVNLLLANQADVNALDHEGHSVVHWATVCGEVEALRAVLIAGANVATPDINGGSPLHYAAQMCGANYDNKVNPSSTKLALEILGILLAHPKSSVEVVDKDGRQPLLWAASAGSAKAVTALVKAGARVESADKDGLTALHCAASRGHTESIDTLISLCGAPTDLIDSNGCTALHYAVTLGHADATSLLLDLEADPNRQDRKGRTPAHCGCAKGQFETVKLLKERNANLWLRNAKGDLPVHEAALSGRRELVEWLLEQRPKQVNTSSNDGRSLLHIAAGNDNTDMCKMLLDFGADINCIYKNSKGIVMTPLDCALQKGYRSTAKFLQSNGGLPVNKLHLSARRPNAFNDQELVKPLKYVEREEIYDLKSSKKYVIYVKRSDSESSECSCVLYENKQDFLSERKCKHRRKKLRRRTSSCSETKYMRDDSSNDILRSKSNIEIRRKKSQERVFSSEEEDNDSCENCCRHKRKFRHRRKNRKTKDYVTLNVVDVTEKSKRVGENYQTIMQNKNMSTTTAGPTEESLKISLETTELNNQNEDDSGTAFETKPGQSLNKAEKPETNFRKEATFIKSSTEEEKKQEVDPLDLTDEENLPESQKVIIQAEVHQEKQCSNGIVEEQSIEPEKVVETARSEVENVISEALQTAEKIRTNSAASEPNDARDEADTLEVTGPEVSENIELGKTEEVESEVEAVPNEAPDKGSIKEESVILEPPEDVTQENIPVDKEGTMEKEEKQPQTSTSQNEINIPAEEYIEPSVAEEIDIQKHTIIPQSEEPATPQTSNLEEKSPTDENYRMKRQSEGRQSFIVITDSTAEDALPRKSSFTVLKSDESVDIYEAEDTFKDRNFELMTNGMATQRKLSGRLYSSEDGGDSLEEEEGEDVEDGLPQRDHNQGPLSRQSIIVSPQHDYNGRKRRLKRRIRSSEKARTWRGEGLQQASRDQDSGFEPSPRASKTKIPSPRSIHTSILPRRPIYTTLDSRSCSSRAEARKPGDKHACNMTAVTRSIQRNIRRYYMERKIFQHLLELKSLQIRSSKLNESVLVKRAVDDYHKSCLSLGAEIGGSLRRYPYTEYTFKNFEMFLYETLKGLQKNGTNNFQNINEVYEEAERRLSPDYNAYERALQCTTKTHRCLHAAHAYTGIPCAAYIPMMNHHTMPKLGFGPYKKTGVGSFYLPKILTSKSKYGGKVSVELSHGKNKRLISLPADKLDSNKRYYVTFTVKGAEIDRKSMKHDTTQESLERK